MDKYNLVSFCGLFILIGAAWLISENKNRLNSRVIIWGTLIQLILAVFIFTVPAGIKIFLFLNHAVVKILESSLYGAKFVFGRLALPPGQINELGQSSLGFILAFQAFPTIIFFSALISVLYFFNIMPKIIKFFARLFTSLMRISGAESLVAASNIFVGIESTLTVKPHLDSMTRSEFCTVLTVGMATVASSVLALYVYILRGVFPTIAAHLISASLLSAPAALVMSKIIVPETSSPKTLGAHINPYYEREGNLMNAVSDGANSGLKMIGGIIALLIAVLGLVSLSDSILRFFGTKLNELLGFNLDWSLKGLLGYIFYPFTLIIGVPPQDAVHISKIIAERSIVTEVVAYQDLSQIMKQNLLVHPRSAFIATYALCGFAHLASMAIFVGGVSALVKNKKNVITAVAFKSLIAATLACLMTACVAGMFFTQNSILLSGIY